MDNAVLMLSPVALLRLHVSDCDMCRLTSDHLDLDTRSITLPNGFGNFRSHRTVVAKRSDPGQIVEQGIEINGTLLVVSGLPRTPAIELAICNSDRPQRCSGKRIDLPSTDIRAVANDVSSNDPETVTSVHSLRTTSAAPLTSTRCPVSER